MVWWHIVLALVFCGIGRTSCKPSSGHDWRDHVAGGLAGGLTTALLYPIDTVKTILQTNPNVHSIREALAFARTEGLGSSGVYSGLMPTVMGAIPSSSLYFGTYELAKKSLRSKLGARHSHWINVLAAASGNVVSSVLLVPKETIKLQLQAFSTGAVARPAAFPLTSAGISRYIYRRYGIRGFFPSYHATLLRNIPSTAIRFVIYEELKVHINRHLKGKFRDAGLMVAGAAASCVASAVTTPLDLVKTRMSTGLLRPGSPLLGSIVQIGQKEGLGALFAGLQTRVLWSALYGGIGMTAYELSRRFLTASGTAELKSTERKP